MDDSQTGGDAQHPQLPDRIPFSPLVLVALDKLQAEKSGEMTPASSRLLVLLVRQEAFYLPFQYSSENIVDL